MGRHTTPASCKWVQSWAARALEAQSRSLSSWPLQTTLSMKIGPVPWPYTAWVRGTAPKHQKLHMYQQVIQQTKRHLQLHVHAKFIYQTKSLKKYYLNMSILAFTIQAPINFHTITNFQGEHIRVCNHISQVSDHKDEYKASMGIILDTTWE